MRSFAFLSLLCYGLFALIPLPLYGIEAVVPSPNTPTAEAAPAPQNSSAPSADTAAVFKVLDASSQTIYTFAERDFLIYTVAAEMPASYPEEALKAQAVATYTYYSYKRAHADASLQGAHFADMPSTFPAAFSPEGLKQQWGDDYDRHLKKVATAVDAVWGKTVRYDGQPIFAAYHSCNGGKTESSSVVWGTDFAYLQPVASAGDTTVGTTVSTVTVSDADFKAAFPKLSLAGNADSWITGTPTVSPSGTVTAITVGGSTVTGKQLREAFKLRSACFTVKHTADGFVFTVHGYGHLVGMSQYGARAMADQGFSYDEILKHYYTGVEIV